MKLITEENCANEWHNQMVKDKTEWLSIAIVSAYYASGGKSEDVLEAFRCSAFQQLKDCAGSLSPQKVGEVFREYNPKTKD